MMVNIIEISVQWACFIVLFKCSVTHGLTNVTEREVLIKQVFQSCSIRFSLIEAVRSVIPCKKVRELNPICGRDLTVSFSDMPPYVHNKTGKIVGFLPALLEEIIAKVCCLGCTNITYLPEEDFLGKLIKPLWTSDIVMPIQNHDSHKFFFSSPYQTLLFVQKISIFSKQIHNPPNNIMSTLFWSLLRTWPILLMALSLAVLAGCIIWLLDTWSNKKQFPRGIPYGPFEGLWWAFVSMTTVGYGDRTPSSVAARGFAIIWIFVGISIFNMYTGTITSVITAELQKDLKFSIFREKVGVLENITAPNSAIILAGSDPVVYKSVDELKRALKNEEIKAIAMESSMLQYYKKELQTLGTEYKVQQDLSSTGSGIGFIAPEGQITSMVQNFYQANKDNLDTFWHQAHRSYFNYKFHEVPTEHDETDYGKKVFTAEHITFPFTIATTIFISLVCVLVGKFTNTHIQKKKSFQMSVSSNNSQQTFQRHKDSTCITPFHCKSKSRERTG